MCTIVHILPETSNSLIRSTVKVSYPIHLHIVLQPMLMDEDDDYTGRQLYKICDALGRLNLFEIEQVFLKVEEEITKNYSEFIRDKTRRSFD